uniref:ZP domain-containing protein n=1 Tax=Heterorhabditis bacteriophora TaxID=37862 RepID=A0A1I7X6A6_HETBA
MLRTLTLSDGLVIAWQIAYILFPTVYGHLDSEGQFFRFAFVRDAKVDINNQTLSVTVINANSEPCNFTLNLRETCHSNLIPKTVLVKRKAAAEVRIPSWYGFRYATFGSAQVGTGPNQTLIANASCPVTVIANNYESSSQKGDSFLVLPTTWSFPGNTYSFSLPPAPEKEYHQITIIPTDVDSQITLIVKSLSDPLNFTAPFGDQPTTYFAMITYGKPWSYQIHSDKPIQVVAGVTCAGAEKGCDHAAFMPQPLPSQEINPNETSVLHSFCEKNFESTVNFVAEKSYIHVTRYLDGNDGSGAFLTTVPSVSQFINESSSFYTRNDNDTLEIICNLYSCLNMKIDNESLGDYNYTKRKMINNKMFFSIRLVIPKKGFHIIDIPSTFESSYIYYVTGKNLKSSYGYLPAVKKPSFTPPSTKPTTPSYQTTTSALLTTTTPSYQTTTSALLTTTTPSYQTTTSALLTTTTPSYQTTTSALLTTTTPSYQTTTSALLTTTTPSTKISRERQTAPFIALMLSAHLVMLMQ